MGQLQQLTLGMRDEIARARMVPIGTPFTRFRRAAREMARATGKEVNLVTSGEHTEIATWGRRASRRSPCSPGRGTRSTMGLSRRHSPQPRQSGGRHDLSSRSSPRKLGAH